MKKILLFLALITISLTQAQVSLVKDIGTTSYQGVENEFINYNGTLLFSAGIDSNNFELWKSDGTESGTISVKDLGFPTEKPEDFFYSPSLNLILFSAGSSSGARCWETDGTETGTIKLSETFTFIKNFTEFNNEVIFRGGQFGATLSKTDGTVSGTVSLSNTIFNADSFFAFNNRLFFSANDGGSGFELYSSDGTTSGTSLFLDIYSGSNSSSPDQLTLFNGNLYFSADDGTNGRELWVTDGTLVGTSRVFDIIPVAEDLKNPENLIVYNNALYFTATHPTLGIELFKLAGNSITNPKNIAAGGGNSNPSNLFVFDNKLYFSADDNTNGIELWSSGGFTSNTNMVKDINTSAATPDSNPSGFTEYNGKLYFSANNDTNGRELWATDGTTAGTVLVDDINTSGDSNPENLTVAGDNLFFSATTPATGKELFKHSTNPQITALNPADDATSVLVDSNLTLTFDRNIQINTGNIIVYRDIDDIVVETISVSSTNVTVNANEAIIDLTSDLVNNTDYYVQIDNGAFEDTDNNDFAGISDKTTWIFKTIGLQNQTITFNALANKTFGDADFSLTATASSNLAVSYTSSDTNVAIIIGNTVTIVGAGTTTITASQPGDASYNAATDVAQTLTVDKANQTITFNALPDVTFSTGLIILTASSSSGLSINYTSSDPSIGNIIGVNNDRVSVLGAGTIDITASQSGNSNYNAASNVVQSLTINRAPDEVTLTLSSSTVSFNDNNFGLTAGANSGEAIVFSSSDTNVITFVNNSLTFVGVGTTTITATQPGTDNYLPASDSKVLTVIKADQTITFNPLADVDVTDPDFNLTAVSSGGLPISYVSSDPSVASVTGNVVSINTIGTTTFTASQTGNTHYNAATAVSQTLTVSTGLSTDDFDKLDFKLYPNPSKTTFRIDTEKIITSMSIYNIHGQLVKTFLNFQEHYSIEDLTAGIYFVNINTYEGKITKKLIKE